MIRMLVIVAALASCSPTHREDNAQRARNAIDVEGYREAIGQCEAQAKATKSSEVFEECARRADTKYGFDGGAK